MDETNGFHRWTIKPDMLKRIKKAKKGREFQSAVFKLYHMRWRIDIIPNGDGKGKFSVFLKLMDVSRKCKHLMVQKTIFCPQTKISDTYCAKYDHINRHFGWDGAMKLKQIQNCHTLQFEVTIAILSICLNDDSLSFGHTIQPRLHSTLQWKIDVASLKKIKVSENGNIFESATHDQIWRLAVCPNGWNPEDRGCCEVYLNLCALPHNVHKIRTEWKMECIVNGKTPQPVCTQGTHLFNMYGQGEYSRCWGNNILSFDEVKKCASLELRAEINLLNVYDLNGNDITAKFVKVKAEQTDVDSDSIMVLSDDEVKVDAVRGLHMKKKCKAEGKEDMHSLPVFRDDQKAKNQEQADNCSNNTNSSLMNTEKHEEQKKAEMDNKPESQKRKRKEREDEEEQQPPARKQRKLKGNKLEWSVDEVAVWVASLGRNYKAYGQIFNGDGIDGAFLDTLQIDDLQEMVPNRVHRKNIIFRWMRL